MPCVLPIIGIKAIQLQKSSTSRIRNSIYYQAGVSLSIISLYLLLVGLKHIGLTVGWGFQLQSPITIQLLIILFIGLLLATLDIMVIQAPSFLQNKSSSNMFWSGILTTIVATPCTAPFLGTALAFALFQPIHIGLIIFISLSIGLGAPMIFITLNPFKQSILPKSGNWNNTLKYCLSFGFILTIIWLSWILSSQINNAKLAIFYGSIFFITLLFMIKKINHLTIKKIIPIILTIIGVLIVSFSSSHHEKWLHYKPSLIKKYEETNTAFLLMLRQNGA